MPEEKTLEQSASSARVRRLRRENGVTIQLEVHGAETSPVPRIRKIFDYGGNHRGEGWLELEQTDFSSTAASKPTSSAEGSDAPGAHGDLYLEEFLQRSSPTWPR